MIPDLVLTIGIPGSGKSKWVQSVSGIYKVVSPDVLRLRYLGDVNNQENGRLIWTIAKAITHEYLLDGINILIDATNVCASERQWFINGLPPCNLKAKIFDILPDEAFQRIQNDINAGKNRSNVPKERIDKMYQKFLHTMKVLPEEGFSIID